MNEEYTPTICKCGVNEELDPHPCPYAQEINGSAKECCCCQQCIQDCINEI